MGKVWVTVLTVLFGVGLQGVAVADEADCIDNSSKAGCESPETRVDETILVPAENKVGEKEGSNATFSKAGEEAETPDVPENTDWTTQKYMKGGNVSIFNWGLSQVFTDGKDMNLNTITVPIKVDIPTISSSDFTLDEASLEEWVDVAVRLRTRGYNIILEPFPYIDDGKEIETNWKPCNWDESDGSDWVKCEQFMSTWGDISKQFAKIAQEREFYGIYIGSNFQSFEHYPAVSTFYNNLIDEIKNDIGYEGQVIYRTNWWYSPAQLESKKEIAFFKNLDILAIAAYFEVSSDPYSTTEILKARINESYVQWDPEDYDNPAKVRKQPIKSEIEQLHNATGVPITFGELGIIDYWGFFDKPWDSWPGKTGPTSEKSQEAQRNWFKAWIEEMNDFEWFKGWSIFALSTGESHYTPQQMLIEYLSTLDDEGNTDHALKLHDYVEGRRAEVGL